MTYRNGNYCAFYVKEPFSSTNLAADATFDFCYYRMIQTWKAKDNAFPFIDSHGKTYSVRDNSDFEQTLKPRLRERLRLSKNIILILSSTTIESNALNEEIDYGINTLGLPVIIIYPDYKEKEDIADTLKKEIKQQAKNMWKRLPILEGSINNVPTIHIPFKEELLKKALCDSELTIQGKTGTQCFYYP